MTFEQKDQALFTFYKPKQFQSQEQKQLSQINALKIEVSNGRNNCINSHQQKETKSFYLGFLKNKVPNQCTKSLLLHIQAQNINSESTVNYNMTDQKHNILFSNISIPKQKASLNSLNKFSQPLLKRTEMLKSNCFQTLPIERKQCQRKIDPSKSVGNKPIHYSKIQSNKKLQTFNSYAPIFKQISMTNNVRISYNNENFLRILSLNAQRASLANEQSNQKYNRKNILRKNSILQRTKISKQKLMKKYSLPLLSNQKGKRKNIRILCSSQMSSTKSNSRKRLSNDINLKGKSLQYL